ncbi:MAG: YbjQ family protein [Sedimentisphaeraceae bacterium JB056]
MEPVIIQLSIFAGLLLLALISGTLIGICHSRSIKKRQIALSHMVVTNFKTTHGNVDSLRNSTLVTGETVFTSDYLRNFISGLRKIFGGEMKSYRALMERAEKEAILRMLEEAQARGYNSVCNVRVSFSNISGMRKNNAIAIEVLASGTAYFANRKYNL